jgi:hypothetical protein
MSICDLTYSQTELLSYEGLDNPSSHYSKEGASETSGYALETYKRSSIGMYGLVLVSDKCEMFLEAVMARRNFLVRPEIDWLTSK